MAFPLPFTFVPQTSPLAPDSFPLYCCALILFSLPKVCRTIWPRSEPRQSSPYAVVAVSSFSSSSLSSLFFVFYFLFSFFHLFSSPFASEHPTIFLVPFFRLCFFFFFFLLIFDLVRILLQLISPTMAGGLFSMDRSCVSRKSKATESPADDASTCVALTFISSTTLSFS
jgi:hypothetical protein